MPPKLKMIHCPSNGFRTLKDGKFVSVPAKRRLLDMSSVQEESQDKSAVNNEEYNVFSQSTFQESKCLDELPIVFELDCHLFLISSRMYVPNGSHYINLLILW